MATWHQMKAKAPIGTPHATQWRIWTNPPGELATCMTFPAEAAAKETLLLWQSRGDKHSWIVPPAVAPSGATVTLTDTERALVLQALQRMAEDFEIAAVSAPTLAFASTAREVHILINKVKESQ